MKNRKTIGVVGQGFVGTAIREKFREHFNIKAYDKFNKETSVTFTKDNIFEDTPINNISTLVEECNIIFVCVPTPMYKDGECDIRIVEDVLKEISKEATFYNKKVIVIIKSTIPPGTTKKLNLIYTNLGIVFNPEFLTEANATDDFKNQNRIVLGVDYVEYVEPVMEIFTKCFPKADIICINSDEAEMTKYATNLFLATKVSFFNDIYTLCEKLNINYDNMIEATMHDPRIGKSHHLVPGPDGDRGFGGHCFPKDINAIMNISEKLGITIPTIVGAHVTNTIVRKDKDWEKMEGRAVSTRELENNSISIEEINDAPTNGNWCYPDKIK